MFGFNKDKGEVISVGVEDVEKYRVFVDVFDVFNFLSNVFGGGINMING